MKLLKAIFLEPTLDPHTAYVFVTCLSRVREEEALAPLSAPVFRPSGTHSSNIHPFLHLYIRFPDRLVAMFSSPIIFF